MRQGVRSRSSQYRNMGEKMKTKRLTVNEENLDPTDLAMLQHRLNFDMGDNYAALLAFTEAMEKGLYPPLWCLEWLQNAFLNYRSGHSKKKSLDRLLGLNSDSRMNEAKKDFIDRKHLNIFNGVVSLLALGVEKKVAFYVISRHLTEQCGEPHTTAGVKKIFHRVEKVYPNYLEETKQKAANFTDEERRNFLRLYKL